MDTDIRVLFIAGFGPIIRDHDASTSLYREALGIHFDEMEGGYLHTEKLQGAKAFGLWPLSQASESCFGTKDWPENLPVPQAWIEFDVESIENATETLKNRGYKLLVFARKEPWGQIVTRMLSPEGLLVGITHTPWMREK